MRRGSLVLVFLLGVVLGGGVVWLALDRGARAPTADLLDGTGPGATAPTPADGRALAARGSSATGVRADAAAAASSRPAAAPSAPPTAPLPDDAEPPPLPTIEVYVARADGIPDDWSGTAYALPAGAPGVDADREVPHAAVGLEKPAVFPVVGPGRYDVGVVWQGAWVLVRDVTVAAGAPARVDVALPVSAPVHVVAVGEAGAADAGSIGGSVQLVPAGDGVARAFPGRDERASVVAEAQIESLPGAADTPPLPRQGLYDVRCTLHQIVELSFGGGSMRAMMQGPTDRRLVPTPTSVRGGGEVRVAPEKLATWTLRWRCDPLPWPRERLRATYRLTVPGERVASEGTVERLAGDTAGPLGDEARSGPPGTYRLTWSGAGVAPGEASVTLGAGEAVTTDVVLRHDAAAGADDELPVDVGRAVVAGATVVAAGLDGTGPQATERTDVWQAPRGVLGLGWRRASAVFAWCGDRVSRAAPPPASGEWRPALETGGFVAIVPDPSPDPALGGLTVRRTDGGMLLRRQSDVPGGAVASREQAVDPGSLLGPFPPGEVVLEARFAGATLPPASLVVRAGRVTTWTLRWR
ncbi:MAG: hypothetical protein IT460_08295 [Planctomycetes bacterium]|nr:hypothetical protein [Planctomycetota bacterium]